MTRMHPLTGAILIRGTRPILLRFGLLNKVIDMPGWYAVEDLAGDDGFHDAEDMRVFDQAIADLKAAADC